MSDASLIFLPWVRQGMAARIATADPLKTPLPAQAPLDVSLAVNEVDVSPVPVRLFGPADVIGIDPRQVVRTEPPAGTIGYESNDLAAIEFDNPDLPWLFTPAAADSQGRLRPWLVLVVVRKQLGVRLRPARDEPLPVLEIGSRAVIAAELPDLADSWAWAHAQLATGEGAAEPKAREEELRNVLATRPELSISRLLSPRLLAPFTDYVACVVPAFQAGLNAGLGKSANADAPLAPAWLSGAAAPAVIALPVYYHWEFSTGAREDFESIVARLAPRDLSNTGRRPMDIAQPGFSVPATVTPTVMLEGALQPVDAPRAEFPDTATTSWQQTLQSIINAANARERSGNKRPVVGPPIYGCWYAGRHEVGTVAPRSWLDDLNLDPRERVAAGLGTRVIQRQQEELMADAWEQAGEMAHANQRLRQMQLSLAITSRLHAHHVGRMNDVDALWRFAAPALSRLVIPAAAPGAAPTSLRSMLARSTTPQATTSAAMRRMSRPRGAISRRGLTAMRIAGGQSPAITGANRVSSMFRVFHPQPQLMALMRPPRGLVSFDAVTRTLPAGFANMLYSRFTDAVINSIGPHPLFDVKGEAVKVNHNILDTASHIGLKGGIQGGIVGGQHSPLQPGGPTKPPAAPGGGDSADAKAFREAAVRHLAQVNPQSHLIIVSILKTAGPPVFNPVPMQVFELLDPAPALRRRMAATIQVAGSDKPREIGPLGGTPVFTQPMSEPLAALSQDWLLPGIETVPPDSVAMLEPNERFIEAFMLGLNVEMGRELLWRDFFVSDARATYFRRFWRTVKPTSGGDIDKIAQWANRRLGDNKAPKIAGKQVVLLVRSDLFRRYPTAVVYAVPGIRHGKGRKPNELEDELHPLFRGALQPDVSFFGFDLDPHEAVSDPGWYFVIQQQPTEPRFGFDVEIDFSAATHVPLAAAPAGHTLPAGTQWALNGAHMARITQQQPVRVAIHAGELI